MNSMDPTPELHQPEEKVAYWYAYTWGLLAFLKGTLEGRWVVESISIDVFRSLFVVVDEARVRECTSIRRDIRASSFVQRMDRG